jgi:lactate permease
VYTQDFSPVSDSLALTSIFAVLPLVTLFVLLGGVKMKAQWAALISLLVAMIVALAVYGMPFGQTALSATEGAAFGLFPIMWIVVTAIWVYNMTVETGHFAVLRRSFGTISEDQRVQAVIVAFCFGALMEALAGFGTPVAISSVMLIALGFRPPRSRSSRTPPRSPSARSPSRSRRCPRSPASTRAISARWSAARRHFSP